MTIKQISIFLENRPGQLAGICRAHGTSRDIRGERLTRRRALELSAQDMPRKPLPVVKTRSRAETDKGDAHGMRRREAR